jgi:hypothetical protein
VAMKLLKQPMKIATSNRAQANRAVRSEQRAHSACTNVLQAWEIGEKTIRCLPKVDQSSGPTPSPHMQFPTTNQWCEMPSGLSLLLPSRSVCFHTISLCVFPHYGVIFIQGHKKQFFSLISIFSDKMFKTFMIYFLPLLSKNL